MKLDCHKIGLAGGITSAIFHTARSLLLFFWPEKTIEMSASLFHLSSFGPLTPYFDFSLPIFISGLIQCFVYAYIYFYLLSCIYMKVHKI